MNFVAQPNPLVCTLQVDEDSSANGDSDWLQDATNDDSIMMAPIDGLEFVSPIRQPRVPDVRPFEFLISLCSFVALAQDGIA